MQGVAGHGMACLVMRSMLTVFPQRAFRQRKEGYIKKLEEQVRELHTLEENFKAIQNENYSLREYIIHLQSRLIESQGDFPQPPPNVNLNQPRPEPVPQPTHQTPPAPPLGEATLDALRASAAQAVAGMAESKHIPNTATYPQPKPEQRPGTEEEILKRQLQGAQDGLPPA